MITTTPLLHFGLQCSSAHITEDDNAVLYRVSHCHDEFSDSEWISFSGTGYSFTRSPALSLMEQKQQKSGRCALMVTRHGGLH
ncbi:DUF5983 family protein [Yersinia intermedia]|uniref:DUF5983 family protein n=1 Tax=Yersinia intermedia TaxID=631 RepID=UPI003BAEE8F5